MAIDDILKALMESAAAQQRPQQGSSGADAMSEILGGMLGGSQQQGGGGDMISQAIGTLLGGQQGGGATGVSPLLGGLEQILGGTPGTGQALAPGGVGSAMTPGNPIMLLLQPIINKVAAKLGISPQVATLIASIALHYLVQSSPRTPGASPLDLRSVLRALASGKKVSPTTLQQSGMVSDVVQATGMTEQEAVRSLNTTLGIMGSELTPVRKVSGTKGVKSGRGVKGKATVTRRKS